MQELEDVKWCTCMMFKIFLMSCILALFRFFKEPFRHHNIRMKPSRYSNCKTPNVVIYVHFRDSSRNNFFAFSYGDKTFKSQNLEDAKRCTYTISKNSFAYGVLQFSAIFRQCWREKHQKRSDYVGKRFTLGVSFDFSVEIYGRPGYVAQRIVWKEAHDTGCLWHIKRRRS